MNSVFDRVANIVGKGEIADYLHFSPFPKTFLKAFFCRAVKTRNCLGKGWALFSHLARLIYDCNLLNNLTEIALNFVWNFTFTGQMVSSKSMGTILKQKFICDLDLWPMWPKNKREPPWPMENIYVKFNIPRSNSFWVKVLKWFSHEVHIIMTLTFDPCDPNAVGHFLLFAQRFLLFRKIFHDFCNKYIVACKCFQFGRV